MATGLSKTKWNGNFLQVAAFNMNALGVELSFSGKKAACDVLDGTRAECTVFWKSKTANGHNNELYFGDNLPILLRLLDDSEIAGNVKLIYIDPPYATNSVFQAKGQKDAYHDLLQGADYLEFLRERLIVMHKLLADDGSIYVHLDENMAFEVKHITKTGG